MTDEHERLVIIAGYTIGFDLCMKLVPKATRWEPFTACAASGAVLVVFFSENLWNVGNVMQH